MKLKKMYMLLALAHFGQLAFTQEGANLAKPIVKDDVVFEETNGILAIEAEYFYQQSATNLRQWYITAKDKWARPGNDGDGPHVKNASNNAYIEILPDTRVTHADKLIDGENFSGTPGVAAVVHYKAYFNNPGRYYVWVRAHSTGSEDNGIHVGIDGDWPESGQRMQWCEGKYTWRWDSKQRTDKQHCGVPWQIYLDIDKAGEHDIQFSMREDGFEIDKFIFVNDTNYKPGETMGPDIRIKSGALPDAFPVVDEDPVLELSFIDKVEKAIPGTKLLKAVTFPVEGTNYYNNDNKWLAINPSYFKEAKSTLEYNAKAGIFDMVLLAVGENDGQSEYKIWVNETEIGSFKVPLSKLSFEEGANYCELWENVNLEKGDKITVLAKIGSADGVEYSRGRWSGIALLPQTKGKELLEAIKTFNTVAKEVPVEPVFVEPELPFSDPTERLVDGDGSITIDGELKQWHKVTLTLDGPFAHELDESPNAFTDYNMTVTFVHESGKYRYTVPGYFAADGNAAETSADRGTKWRAHLSPDEPGKWIYTISFKKGKMAALIDVPWANALAPYDGISGNFRVEPTDKSGRDFRGKGRLEYVGKHHLQFQGSKEYFIKAGADAPETFLAYTGFDATYTMKKELKDWAPHIQDWNEGDPTWKDGQGKGIIGALNYLSEKGVNAVSFLTYNTQGDGDNLWPFVKRFEKLHYDCSKLDQWGIVFDHAQELGLYLHFKTQETENDDNNRGKKFTGVVEAALDGGDLGPERRLYYRELLARYAYLLALNWNLGEENTQTTAQQKAMAKYFKDNCPYNQNIVLHTYPWQQESVYYPLLGGNSELTGVSLQNEWDDVHHRTLQWVTYSSLTHKPWVVANDEQGSAGLGVPPEPGYKGFEADKLGYDLNDVRKETLWGNLMAGGAGVEYYFGYKLAENDLVCEDYRSRDKSWDYCRVAIDFFHSGIVPFWEMKNANNLIANSDNTKDKYCLAKKGQIYLVYLAYAPTTTLDLTKEEGSYSIQWFNPREGGKLKKGSVKTVDGGGIVDLGTPPANPEEDWVVIIKKD